MPESPDQDSPERGPRVEGDQPAEQEIEEAGDAWEEGDSETWRPGQGRWFRAVVWALLVLMLLCAAAGVVLLIGAVGKKTPG